MRILLLLSACAALGCGPDKPVVTPNPVAADCIADRGAAELACVKDNSTRAAADDCIAKVKAQHECTDGGK